MRVEIYGIPLEAGKEQHTLIMIKELPYDSALSTNRTSKYKRPFWALFKENPK